MRILDMNDREVTSPDLDKGYLIDDRIMVAHHEATPAVKETGHFETLKEYPNGGKDIIWVTDTPAMAARPAWDEYEDIQRYIEYTEEELLAMEQAKRTVWDDLADAIREGVNMV